MSHKPAIRVKTALVTKFNAEHDAFLAAAKAAAGEAVTAINKMRVMGILLKELLARENITETCLAGWLAENPGLLAETEVAWLMNYVRVSNKQQGELKLFSEAPRDLLQMSFQCAGLLPPNAGRDGEQFRHEPAVISVMWKCLADVRVKSDLLLKDARRWDDETRAVVIQDIHKLKLFLEELEQKLDVRGLCAAARVNEQETT